MSQYRVEARLGAGGMGEVYRAVDQRLGRAVALKVLPPELAEDPERLARLVREARALAAVTHSGVATIYDIEDADGVRFPVLELVEGEMLEQRLALGPVRRTGGIIRDMVHYDVTPDGERFVAVIADASNEEIRVVLNWPLLLGNR